MAKMTPRKPPAPIKIDNFRGINEGDVGISPEEWSSGFNFRVNEVYNLEKRPGTHTFIDFEAAGNAQGIYEGTISGKNIMITCWNGNIYEYDMSVDTETVLVSDLMTEGTVTIIGTITDVKTSIFWFNDLIYFLNGTDFKQYDGTTYQDVVPYIPTIALNAPPAGGGTLFEELNLLTGAFTQTFIGDGSSTLYQLAQSDLDVDTVACTVDGVAKTEGVDFTVNRTLGQVTFTVAPVNEAQVSLTAVKVIAGNADLVKNHKYALDFGVNNDTNLFIFGNPNEKHVFRFSGINKANYFPANSFVGVGSTEFAITDLQEQYQSLLVFKEKATFIVNPTVNPNFTDNTGLNPYNFGYQGLNDRIGNLAPNMVQLINDTPISLFGHSMRQFTSNRSVRNEVEPIVISDRLQKSLEVLNLAPAVTFDYEQKKEYWVNIDSIVYIWNYGNDTMYKYSGIQATEFIEVDSDIYYASNGKVMHVSENFVADGEVLGDTIPCKIYSGALDFDALQFKKMMRDEWIAIEPDSRTSVRIKFVSDRVNEEQAEWKEVEYKLLDFDDIDFDDFSFETNREAQSNRIKYKVKKFAYLRWILENDTNNQTLTVLKILLQCQTQGFSG